MSEENAVVTEKPRKKKRSLWWLWFLLLLLAFAGGAIVGLKLNTLPLPNEMRDKLYPVLESYIPGSTAVHTPLPEAVTPAPTAAPEPAETPAPIVESEAAETPAPVAETEPAETPAPAAETEPAETPAPAAETETAETPAPLVETEAAAVPETPVPFILPALSAPAAETEPDTAPAAIETAAPEESAAAEGEVLRVNDTAVFESEATSVKYIGVGAAIDAALSHAKIAEQDAEITGVVRTKDEDGKAVYQVDFSVGEIKYDYTVDALSGEIDGFQMSGMTFSDTAAFAAGFSGDTLTESEAAEPPAETISEERAMEIAYKHASVKAGEVIRVTVETKTDTENNGAEFYHLAFRTATKSFEYDIDPNSGEILGFVKK